MRSCLQALIRWIGDGALLLKELPRSTAWQLTGNEWKIVFVGSEVGCLDFQKAIFASSEFVAREIGRIRLDHLQTQMELWWKSGIHLVVCETSRIYPWRLWARWRFTSPTWIDQLLVLPEKPEDVLSGKQMRGPRRRIQQAWQDGFSYFFTQSLEEHRHFYQEMYLPFIKARHGAQALIAPIEDQRKRWLSKGGLLLVTQHDRPVAGSLLYRTGEMWHGIEEGILHNDPALMQLGINAILVWSTILWSHGQGAKYLSLGGSHAWCENGPFDFKKQWGAQVVRRNKIHPVWTFLSESLPDSLKDRLNQIRFLHEMNDRFYIIRLNNEVSSGSAPTLQEYSVEEQKRYGLAGVIQIYASTPN